MNIEKKLPKPWLRYHHSKGYWTCKGHGASTAAVTPERAYKAWVNSRAERRRNGTTDTPQTFVSRRRA